MKTIHSVCFVGAGTMGCFNALMAASAGHRAVLYDISDHVLRQGPDALQEMADSLVAFGFFTADIIPDALQRIVFEADLKKAISGVDLISESVAENIDIKRTVHQQLDQLCDEKTILTTNTSALLVTDIEVAVGRSDAFAALHSHLGSRLIDIVGGANTSQEIIDTLCRYVESIEGYPLVLKKPYPGYVLNAMLGPVLTLSMMLVIENVSTIEQIDSAWMFHFKAPMGPFGMMDLFGLNVVNDSWKKNNLDARAKQLKPKIIHFLSPFITGDELGMKTGKGFYHYPNPSYQRDGFVDTDSSSEFIYQALLVTLIENAIVLADRDVASPEGIDMAWKVGTHLQDGPFELLNALGLANFLSLHAQSVELGLSSSGLAETVGSYLKRVG